MSLAARNSETLPDPMRTRTTLMLLLLCLAGFAFALYNAGDHSGTNDGNLWLLTSLILGVGLISTCLAIIAQFGRLRTLSTPRSDRYAWHNAHGPQFDLPSHRAANPADAPRERHRPLVSRGKNPAGR